MTEEKTPPSNGNKKVYFFIIVICFISAFILAILASSLKTKQENAKKIDQSRQMLIAAKILSHEGYFLVEENGEYEKGYYDEESILPTQKTIKATPSQILDVFEARVNPMLTDTQGGLYTFEEKNISFEDYIEKNQVDGFAKLPLKLIYAVYGNNAGQQDPIAYIIPINGFGLWDAIYGYLAIKNDGNTVIGTTWYDHKETAGLGADIALPSWQEQFENKVIFQQNEEGGVDIAKAPIGIVVVKGKVSDVLGSSPMANSAVDGISGASMTGMGVTDAYRNVLEQYRPFLMKLYKGE